MLQPFATGPASRKTTNVLNQASWSPSHLLDGCHRVAPNAAPTEGVLQHSTDHAMPWLRKEIHGMQVGTPALSHKFLRTPSMHSKNPPEADTASQGAKAAIMASKIIKQSGWRMRLRNTKPDSSGCMAFTTSRGLRTNCKLSSSGSVIWHVAKIARQEVAMQA